MKLLSASVLLSENDAPDDRQQQLCRTNGFNGSKSVLTGKQGQRSQAAKHIPPLTSDTREWQTLRSISEPPDSSVNDKSDYQVKCLCSSVHHHTVRGKVQRLTEQRPQQNVCFLHWLQGFVRWNLKQVFLTQGPAMIVDFTMLLCIK